MFGLNKLIICQSFHSIKGWSGDDVIKNFLTAFYFCFLGFFFFSGGGGWIWYNLLEILQVLRNCITTKYENLLLRHRWSKVALNL